jgi:hypothetical protein
VTTSYDDIDPSETPSLTGEIARAGSEPRASAESDGDVASGTYADPRWWRPLLAATIVLLAVLVALDVPSAVVLAVGMAGAAGAMGTLVADVINDNRVRVFERLRSRSTLLPRLLAHEELDELLHDGVPEGLAALGQLQDRALSRRAPQEETEALAKAAAVLTSLHGEIGETQSERGRLRRLTRDGDDPWLDFTRAGGTSADSDEDDDMLQYSDPINYPEWVPDALEEPLVKIGGILDDVRELHDAQIERAVLLFTMWSRFVFVALAPWLGALSFTVVPLQGGLSIADVPWMLATVCALATAALAPTLTSDVMRRDAHGATIRRRLLWIEVPLAIAVIVTAPCWPVVAFAAGWTNWWQRPVFNWVKLAVWIGAVVGFMIVGDVLFGHAGWAIFAEAGIAMAVIGIIGGSYGAMLVVSVSVLVSSLFGRAVVSRTGQRQADERLKSAIDDLLEAANLTRRYAPATDRTAAADAQRLVDLAQLLAKSSSEQDRRSRRVPLGVQPLVEAALLTAPLAGSRRAHYAIGVARDRNEPEPLTVLGLNVYDARAATLRFKQRRHAKVLDRFVRKVVLEGRRHGTGSMTSTCRIADDVVVLRFANPPKDERANGRGQGGERLVALKDQLPEATMPVRCEVDGRFIDLPAAVLLYGVELRIPLVLMQQLDT